MKKLKVLASAILRGAIIVAPGIAFGAWAWGKAMALISILAAVGVEAVWLLMLVLPVALIEARKGKKPAIEEDVPEVDD